ncbi:RNA polymerase sigma factor [Pseudochryseolinea flava]|uniref:RNA polymerase sigma factor n=1 Tax=Pseudochryseolinea flava TaxID=2059302 RepID=UPI0014023BAD|nr:sigma-70 family RNA polymerase sigma factor [Pseudochryseolinea flava]
MEEKEIVRGCQQGSGKAQEAAYRRYADRLFRLSLRYIPMEAEAEDVVMRAFVKAFKKVNGFNYQRAGSFEAWLRKIVVNEALMTLRSHHNFNMTEALDESMDEPDISSLSSMDATDILQFISQLPTGYRTVFNLFAIEGFDHAEIAEQLNISEVTSRSQLFKAKTLLKKMLSREGYHYGT